MRVHEFEHREREFEIRLTDDGALELWFAGVCRKRRPRSDKTPQYVWTNVELEWEEHHYLEVRYWADTDQLRITVNRQTAFEGAFGSAE